MPLGPASHTYLPHSSFPPLLQVPLFAALWATCDGSGIIGGVSYETSAVGEASFGTVDPKGAYTKKSTVQVSRRES